MIRATMATQYSPFWSPRTKTTIVFGKSVSNTIHSLELLQQSEDNIILTSLRGGNIVTDVEEKNDGGNNEDEDEDEETTTKVTEKTSSIASMGTVQLFISTNWGNSVIDHKIELKSKRTKTVADLKKSLSKQLPGRPPILALDLVYEGRILDEETLMEELFEDEDEDDDEEEEGNELHRKLTLHIVPPVDPKFMTELGPKLMFYSDDVDDDNNFIINSATDIDSLTTTTLVDAYYLNQVAMSLNAHLLADPNTPSSPYTRLESIEQGKQLRDELCAQIGTDTWEKLMKVTTEKSRDENKEEWRGERYRSGKGGVTTQLKTTLQTNLNVNWTDAIKNFVLFLFFGYFGGKNSFSRHLLLWGAPLSFALQARPVKMWLKLIFYMLSNPPSILLSFLPAPQQAILSVDLEKSCVALYGEDGAKNILKQLGLEAENPTNTTKTTTITAEEELDEETDDAEEDYGDIYDDEDEYGDEDDEDEEE